MLKLCNKERVVLILLLIPAYKRIKLFNEESFKVFSEVKEPIKVRKMSQLVALKYLMESAGAKLNRVFSTILPSKQNSGLLQFLLLECPVSEPLTKYV